MSVRVFVWERKSRHASGANSFPGSEIRADRYHHHISRKNLAKSVADATGPAGSGVQHLSALRLAMGSGDRRLAVAEPHGSLASARDVFKFTNLCVIGRLSG